jgi:hypothetical protein
MTIDRLPVLAALLFPFAMASVALSLPASAASGNAADGEAAAVVIDTFPRPVYENTRPAGWEPLHFPRIKKHTRYRVVRDDYSDDGGPGGPGGGEDGNWCLAAVSRGSASGLYKKFEVDLHDHPVLSWRWRIGGVVKGGDARTKAGDDYAARVYVIFRYDPEGRSRIERLRRMAAKAVYGAEPPGQAINYIWAGRLTRGAYLPNPYTDDAMMLAVESGPRLAGRWVAEERNVYEDYKMVFGGEPPLVAGVVVMTDSDNTGGEAEACYDDIVFSAHGQDRAGKE